MFPKVPLVTTFPGSPGKAMTRELPTSTDKLWSIAILDEGPPEPGLDHRKFELLFTRTEFLKRAATGKISVQPAHAAEARAAYGSVYRQRVASLTAETPRLRRKTSEPTSFAVSDLRLGEPGKPQAISPSFMPAFLRKEGCSSPRSSGICTLPAHRNNNRTSPSWP